MAAAAKTASFPHHAVIESSFCEWILDLSNALILLMLQHNEQCDALDNVNCLSVASHWHNGPSLPFFRHSNRLLLDLPSATAGSLQHQIRQASQTICHLCAEQELWW